MLLQVRLLLYLCDRFSNSESTMAKDFAKTLVLWLVEAAAVAGPRAIINRNLAPSKVRELFKLYQFLLSARISLAANSWIGSLVSPLVMV